MDEIRGAIDRAFRGRRGTVEVVADLPGIPNWPKILEATGRRTWRAELRDTFGKVAIYSVRLL